MANLIRDSHSTNVHGLKVVTVKKTELLDRIRKSREQHIAELEPAIKGYYVTLAAALKTAYESALASHDPDPSYLHHEKPRSHVNDYDRVIAMLEMSVDEQLELPAHEFVQYALDEWDWSQQHKMSISTYSHSGSSR